jgi:hypothetical protein
MRDRPLQRDLDEPAAALYAEAEHALFQRHDNEVGHSRRGETVGNQQGGPAVGRRPFGLRGVTLLRRGGLYAELYTLQARNYR